MSALISVVILSSGKSIGHSSEESDATCSTSLSSYLGLLSAKPLANIEAPPFPFASGVLGGGGVASTGCWEFFISESLAWIF